MKGSAGPSRPVIVGRDNEVSASVVMAGDAQMDPKDLPKLLDPVVNGKWTIRRGTVSSPARPGGLSRNPVSGNAVLSFLTKIASGYWHVADSQSVMELLTWRFLRPLISTHLQALWNA